MKTVQIWMGTARKVMIICTLRTYNTSCVIVVKQKIVLRNRPQNLGQTP